MLYSENVIGCRPCILRDRLIYIFGLLDLCVLSCDLNVRCHSFTTVFKTFDISEIFFNSTSEVVHIFARLSFRIWEITEFFEYLKCVTVLPSRTRLAISK